MDRGRGKIIKPQIGGVRRANRISRNRRALAQTRQNRPEGQVGEKTNDCRLTPHGKEGKGGKVVCHTLGQSVWREKNFYPLGVPKGTEGAQRIQGHMDNGEWKRRRRGAGKNPIQRDRAAKDGLGTIISPRGGRGREIQEQKDVREKCYYVSIGNAPGGNRCFKKGKEKKTQNEIPPWRRSRHGKKKKK